MTITFLPDHIEAEIIEGMTVLQAAAAAGAAIDGNCAGAGTCGKCKVKILQGDLSQCEDPHGKLSEYEKQAGIRLACCHRVTGNMVVEIPNTTTTAERKRKLIRLPEGFRISPLVEKCFLQVPETNLKESDSDEDRISSAAGRKLGLSLAAVRKLPQILRETCEITVTVRDGIVTDVEAGDRSRDAYGLAVDIGTTTVVVMLWDLTSGKLKEVDAFTNPQGPYGADVISRIDYIMEEKETRLHHLHQILADRINESICSFEEELEISRNDILDVTVVGNTTMSCIFAEVDPSQLAASPFAPVYVSGVSGKAEEFGIHVNPQAELYIGANIAGHVGSDITAGVITTDLMERDKGHLFLDIGTNGEICLSGNGRAVACSTAAGPAFEGSSIAQGMRAASGAIEKVDLSEEGVTIQTIGNETPVGICGSGIIDAVGELVRTGIVDKSGRMPVPERLRKKNIPEALISHVRSGEDGNAFVLYEGQDGADVLITQKDVREVQLAKAAIAAGISIMLQNIGLGKDAIDEISIAGAFGSYIRTTSAIHVGLLPAVPEERIHSIGNSAGIGASMMLLSKDYRRISEENARAIEHIQLATEPAFQDEYMKAMRF